MSYQSCLEARLLMSQVDRDISESLSLLQGIERLCQIPHLTYTSLNLNDSNLVHPKIDAVCQSCSDLWFDS